MLKTIRSYHSSELPTIISINNLKNHYWQFFFSINLDCLQSRSLKKKKSWKQVVAKILARNARLIHGHRGHCQSTAAFPRDSVRLYSKAIFGKPRRFKCISSNLSFSWQAHEPTFSLSKLSSFNPHVSGWAEPWALAVLPLPELHLMTLAKPGRLWWALKASSPLQTVLST